MKEKRERIPKTPMVRYLILDALFREGVSFHIGELLRRVNDKLVDNGCPTITERTLRADIKYMEDHYNAELIDTKDGKERLYAYKDLEFSIMQMPLTQTERDQLGRTIQMLGHLTGLPHYRWLEQTLVLLRQKFDLEHTGKGGVNFGLLENQTGLDFFTPLYDVMRRRQVVAITYHRFGKPSRVRVVHPYQLRQYNNRWYLVGYEERLGKRHKYAVLALDRMEKIEVLKKVKYIPTSISELEEYYSVVVGVSRLPEGRMDAVRVKAFYPAAHYLATKPIHSSQREIERGDDYVVFQWSVMENEELVQQLIVYADQIEVLRGDWVREKIRERAQKMLENMAK